MKRLLSFLCAVLLMAGSLAAASAESGPEVYSYQFDLRFHLDTKGASGTGRDHLQGYADLLDSLEFRGVVTWCPETVSMDLDAELIPVTNPSAAVSFRLYGIPDYMCLTSPLLNGETVFLHNYALMEFSEKAWLDFRVPLQLVALLNPYATTGAFSSLADAWEKEFGATEKRRSLPFSGLESVSDSWKASLQDDYRLTHWVSAVSALLEDDSYILEYDFASLPSYLTEQVAAGQDLTVTVSDGTMAVTNADGTVLWEQSSSAGKKTLSVSLPETESGYLPSLSYTYTEDGSSFSLDLSAAYRPASDPESGDEDSSRSDADAVAELGLSLVSVPLSWPADTEFTGSAVIRGTLLPNLDCTFRCVSGEDGSFSFSAYSAGQEEEPVLTCTGSIVPVAAESVPAYDAAELITHFNIFSVNDQSLYDFVHRVGRPMLTGLLDFLDEMPPRACQSIMDDLEDSGILDLILK